MARQGKGILGAPSKSVGMITGQKHSGKDTIRSKPKPSIKTQTPELATTKTNFQIANEFWTAYKNSTWIIDHSIKAKQKTLKNHFIGSILKALNYKESGAYNFNLFPNTYNFFKWDYSQSVGQTIIISDINWNKQPYPQQSKSTDFLHYITWHEHKGEIRFRGRNSAWTRARTPPSYSFAFKPEPFERVFIFGVFISEDHKHISNGVLNLYIP